MFFLYFRTEILINL